MRNGETLEAKPQSLNGDDTGNRDLSLSKFFSSLSLKDAAALSGIRKDFGKSADELTFTSITGYSDAARDPHSKKTDGSREFSPREVLLASEAGVGAMNASNDIYRAALDKMSNAGHHIRGGDIQSGIGNILQNSGLSGDTWVCAEQAEFLAKQLRHDQRLTGSHVYLIHTPGYEHLFVGVKDPDGKMIYIDPWREKPPSRESPNKIEGMLEYH